MTERAGAVELVVIKTVPTGQIPVKNLHVVIENAEDPPQEDNSSRPYPCIFCQSRFALKSSLRRHVRAQHNAHPNKDVLLRKAFECRICHMEFESNSDLWHHRQTEHTTHQSSAREMTDDPVAGSHTCSFCPFSYRKFQDLKRHMKARHPEEVHKMIAYNPDDSEASTSVALLEPGEIQAPEQPVPLVAITPENVKGERVTQIPTTMLLAFKCAKGNSNTRKVVEELLNIDVRQKFQPQ